MSRVAIVATLEREVRPLVKRWRVSEREHSSHRFRFFENKNMVLVCGGIGAEAARRATEAIIATYAPEVVYSAGFAGALDPHFRVADVMLPRTVINASDASRVDTGTGQGTLVSFGSVASAAQKAKLRDSFAANAVDMEAASVARAAEARGVRFAVVKVISDESDFTLPPLDPFVDSNGQFLQARFALFAAMRPWLWLQLGRLARHSNRASHALCDWLEKIDSGEVPFVDPRALEAVHRP